MAYDIGPRIGIDGEKEFRAAIQNVTQQVKTLNSDMEVMVASFTDGDEAEKKLTAQSENLNKQIDAQKKKLELLNQGLDKSTDKYGEADTNTLKWKETVNKATTELRKMESQLGDVDKELEDLSDDTKTSKLNLSDFAGALKAGLAGGAIVAGLKEVKDAIFEVVESTEEYRKIMGTLEASSQSAGYTAEETAETYNLLYSVLGDAQTAATAAANLQAIGLKQNDLTNLTKLAIGAWAKYGDSIPIDSMAEAINLGAQQSEISSGLADVLEWAGVNTDEFKEKLEAANSTEERAKMIMAALADEGLMKLADSWMEVNEDIVKANEAQAKWDEQMGRLGEKLSPAKDALVSFGADALEYVIDLFEDAVGWVKSLIDWFNKAQSNGIWSRYSHPEMDDNTIHGSYAGGIDYIPFDNFRAVLHRGEKVVSAWEAESYRNPASSGLDAIASGMVNGVQTAVAGMGGSYTFNLVLPDNTVLARYQLPALLQVANDNGTPILNPQ